MTVPGEQKFWNAEAQTMPVQRRGEVQLTRLREAVDTATNAPFFNISGQITNNGSVLSGVSVTLSGSQQNIVTTDSNQLPGR